MAAACRDDNDGAGLEVDDWTVGPAELHGDYCPKVCEDFVRAGVIVVEVINTVNPCTAPAVCVEKCDGVAGSCAC